MRINSLSEVLLRRSGQDNLASTFIASGSQETSHSFASLYSAALMTLGGLQAAGIKKGDIVLMSVEHPEHFFVVLWACFLGGIVASPVPPVDAATSPATLDFVRNVWTACDESPILYDGAIDRLFAGTTTARVLSVKALFAETQSGRVPDIGPADPALLPFTSGSTGTPKGILLTNENIVAMVRGTAEMNGFSQEDNCLNWMPPEHPGAAVFLGVLPVFLGSRQTHVKTGLILAEPLQWLRLMTAHEIAISWAPNFAFSLVTEAIRRDMPSQVDLHRLSFLVNAGEQVKSHTVLDFLDCLAPLGLRDGALRPAFGMAESCSGITWSSGLTRATLEKDPPYISLGKAIPGAALRVVNEAGVARPDGKTGHLELHGPSVTKGYFRNPEANALAFTPDGWFRTGDMAFLQSGELHITGRNKDEIVLNGRNIPFHIIEKSAETVKGILAAHCCAFAISDKGNSTENLGITFCCIAGEEEDHARIAKDIRRIIGLEFGVQISSIVSLSPEDLPRTDIGKIQRKKLKEAYLSGAFESKIVRLQGAEKDLHRPVAKNAIEQEIASIWEEVLQVPKVGRSENFFDLGGQSILLIRVHGRLAEKFGDFPLADLFLSPTVETQARFFVGRAKPNNAVLRPERRRTSTTRTASDGRDIAVIGMACRFPGADTPEEFWRNLLAGVDSVSRFSVQDALASGIERGLAEDKDYVTASPRLKNAAAFDAGFFGYTAREAELMDPQQRVFLEVAWEAFENAGYDPRAVTDSVGVYAGAAMNTYFVNNVLPNLADFDPKDKLDVFTLDSMGGFQVMVANDKDYLATKVSYKLDLQGPSINLQTACSSGLVVIHEAIKAILAGDCRVALAGTSSVQAPVDAGHLYREGMIVSKDGQCRAFDADASGTIFGSGVGAVLLKRLDDALADGDTVVAVIKGSAVNNDGRRKVGFMAPSQDGESEVAKAALESAGVPAGSIGFVEAHGTGTQIGDPIEVASLALAFQDSSEATQFCALGAVKTNVGHLQISSGIAGFMKAALAVRTGRIPANLHYSRPNPQITFEATPFFIPTETMDWPLSGPRRAGVNSLGIGGTNAHVILEEPPERQFHADPAEAEIVVISARDAEDFENAVARLRVELAGSFDAADLCFTLAAGRHHFGFRKALVIDDGNPFPAALDSLSGVETTVPSGLVFAFTGQGAQYSSMALGLYRDQPVFRCQLDHCANLLSAHLDQPLIDLLRSDDAALSDTAITQPVLFAVEYALARFWMACGLNPAALIGHSLGEYVAAALAGVFSLEDGLRLVAARGRLMADLPRAGTMLAVMIGRSALQPFLAGDPDLHIAACNGPENTVVAGPHQSIAALEIALKAVGIDCRAVATSHAFHCPMMAGAVPEFRKILASVALSEPMIPLVSNVTGKIESGMFASPDYWVRHMLEPVDFQGGVETLRAEGPVRFVEIGPHPVLSGFIRAAGCDAVETLRRGRADQRQTLQAMAYLFEAGHDLNFAPLYEGRNCRRIPLPTYPFKKTRHWLEPKPRLRPVEVLHPLVHRAVPLPGLDLAVFETDLARPAPDWVIDHVVQGRLLVAGAAQLAMLATAGLLSGQTAVQLADIAFLEPLFADQPRRVQLRLTKSAAEVFSYDPDKPGSIRHATGRLAQDALPERPVWLSQVQGLDQTITGDGLRQMLADRQVALGRSYCWLQSVRYGNDFAVSEMARPAGLAVDPAIGLHPGLIDSILQPALMLMAIGSPHDTFVPIALQRFALHRLPDAFPLYGTMRRRPGQGQIVDLHVEDASGRPVLTAEGFELRRLAATDDLAGALVQVVWSPVAAMSKGWDRPAPATYLAGPAVRDPAFQAEMAGVSGPREQQRSEDLEELAIAYLTEAFVAAGAMPAPLQMMDRAQIAARLGLAGEFSQALDRLLHLLVRNGRLIDVGSGRWQGLMMADAPPAADRARRIRGKHGPGIESELALLEAAGSQLGSILSGRTDPLEALFPGGDLAAATALYRDSAGFSALNTLVGRLVGQIAVAAPQDHMLRVLEIGAGTGATTHHVLPYLAPEQSAYVFTDISNLFLKKARENFAACPFMDFQIFDAEKDPMAQGLQADFDVIIASNVLHATASIAETLANVRRLLRPGGYLVLLEVNEPTVPVDLTFGLLKGWWRFRDHDLRPDYPLLSQAQWLTALHQAGFAAAEAADLEIPTPGGLQTVFVAQLSQVEHPRPRTIAVVGKDRIGLADALNKLGVHGPNGVRPDATVLLAQGADDAETLRRIALAGQGGPVHVVTGHDSGTQALWGLMRVLRHEMPDRAGRLISVAPDLPAADLARALLDPDLPAEVDLSLQGCMAPVLMPLLAPLPDPVRIDGDGAYLITGGMGGIGLRLAAALVGQGARHVVLVGRTLRQSAELTALQNAKGVTISIHTVDVTDTNEMAGVVKAITAERPLRGVFHLAGVLRPALLQAEDGLMEHMAAKVKGAEVLDQICADAPGLRHFVLFSSAAAWFGLPGQGAYAAGNAALDALARIRRSRGQAGLSVNWGRWADVGMVAGSGDPAAIKPDAGFSLLFRLMATDLAQVGVLPGDWRQSAEAGMSALVQGQATAAAAIMPVTDRTVVASGDTIDYLTQQIGRLLGGAAGLDKNRTLTELGLDSLMCIDLRARITDDLGVRLTLGVMMETPVVKLSGEIDTARSLGMMPAGATDAAEVEFLL